MNNSSVIPEESVQEINNETTELFTPAIVFICVLMTAGLVGNSMVCYYYGFKAKLKPSSVFIVVLSVHDLIICTVAMPHEIVFNHQYYIYGNRNACKSVFFITHFAASASALTLPAIAIDRNRHIRVSYVYHTTVKDALKQCAILATLALFFSWPVIILYGIEVDPLPIEYGQGLNGTSCTRLKALSTYSLAFDVAYLFLFFLCMAILVVLYFRISKVLYIHRKHFRKCETKTKPQISDNQSNRIDRMTAKLTIGMIAITLVFFLSYIPVLSLTAWRSIKDEREDQFLSGAGLLGFQIGLQSYMLNSSLNPWIYGIFNSQFRKFYFRKLCKHFRDMKDST